MCALGRLGSRGAGRAFILAWAGPPECPTIADVLYRGLTDGGSTPPSVAAMCKVTLALALTVPPLYAAPSTESESNVGVVC